MSIIGIEETKNQQFMNPLKIDNGIDSLDLQLLRVQCCLVYAVLSVVKAAIQISKI